MSPQVTAARPPHGAYNKFVQLGYHTDYLPVWLQDLGYNTYHVGKFLNWYQKNDATSVVPKGW